MKTPSQAGSETVAAALVKRPACARGETELGWLHSRHTFSFGEYLDPDQMGFGALRVINDDIVEPGQGFGTHPHRDMEIISFVLNGQLEHKDSMGHGRIIQTGDFQYMSAGSGVLHSEFNPSATEPVHFLQIWIMPDRKGLAPCYAERSSAATASGGLQLIASKTGRAQSLVIHQDADLWLAKLDAGQTCQYTLAAPRQSWVHVAEGEILLNDMPLVGGDGASGHPATLTIRAVRPSQVLVFDLG